MVDLLVSRLLVGREVLAMCIHGMWLTLMSTVHICLGSGDSISLCSMLPVVIYSDFLGGPHTAWYTWIVCGPHMVGENPGVCVTSDRSVYPTICVTSECNVYMFLSNFLNHDLSKFFDLIQYSYNIYITFISKYFLKSYFLKGPHIAGF